MSTRINVNVGASRLVDQNKQQQQANRAQFVEGQQQKTTEQQAQDKLNAQIAQLLSQREGAVPEYDIREQTSAQRKGAVAMGWLYVTYDDVVEHSYATQNRIRIAVGSGDGTSWDYADAAVEVPENAGNYFIGTGIALQTTITVTATTSVGDPPTVDIPDVITFTYNDNFESFRKNDGFIVPIDDSTCVFVGTAFVGGRIFRRITRSDDLQLPEGFIFVDTDTGSTSSIFSFNGAFFYTVPNTPVVPDAPTTGPISPSYQRLDFSFLITNTQVKRLEVTAQLSSLLQQIFPDPNYQAADFTTPTWPLTQYAGLGVSFSYDSLWGFTKTGAPSIYDILSNNNNFRLFSPVNGGPIPQSRYSSNPPRFSPDSILQAGDPKDKEVPVVYSDFYYGASLPDIPFVFSSQPRRFGADAELNTYVYLTEEQRQDSDYFEFSSPRTKTLLAGLRPDPVFRFLAKKNPNPAVYYETMGGLNVFWSPSSNLDRISPSIRLSPNRVLPPALFSESFTPHPLIRLMPTSYPPSFPDEFGAFGFSTFRFTTLFWTAWGLKLRSAALSIGISFEPFSQSE